MYQSPLLLLCSFWSDVILIFLFCKQGVFSPLASFQIFFFFHWFSEPWIWYTYMQFLDISCLVFPKLPGSVVWCLVLTGRNSAIWLQVLLLFASSFSWFSCYAFLTPFAVVPQFLDLLLSCCHHWFSVFFCFAFQFGKFLPSLSSSSEIL